MATDTQSSVGNDMRYQISMIPKEAVTRCGVSQGDTSLRKFEFELMQGSQMIALNGTETVEFIQSNGSRHTCTIEQGRAYLDAYEDMTAEAGSFRSKLKITDTDGGIIYSAAFTLEVEKRP